MTDSETYIFVVKFYGCLSDGVLPDQDHTVYVRAKEVEDAIQMIKEHHDDCAVIEYVHKRWLLEKDR